MGELGLNKIFGALLATALGLFALHELSGAVFSGSSEGGHGEEHAEATSLSEEMCEKFAYCVEVAGSGGGAEEEEEVFDLGLLLASADAAKGERVFKAQCSTCHTIEAGGANGTGPNLHNTVGAEFGHVESFAYSAAFQATDGTWTYEALNDWLYAPASYVRGTAMSFAGLRRDPDRMNVIAYLAANTENAPAFPDPLPAAGEEAPEGEAAPAEDGVSEEGMAEAGDAAEATEEASEETVIELIEDAAEEATETAEEAFEEEAPSLTEEEAGE